MNHILKGERDWGPGGKLPGIFMQKDSLRHKYKLALGIFKELQVEDSPLISEECGPRPPVDAWNYR